MDSLLIPSLKDCVIQLVKISDYTSQLFLEEQNLIKGMNRARKQEFSAGRYAAKNLLTEMGFMPSPILRDESGCPIWPPSIKGSITHKHALCLVILSQSSKYLSLGADIEVVEDIDESVWKVFTTDAELLNLTSQGISQEVAVNIVFSAKEAIFKCAYPLFGESTSTFIDEQISYESIDHASLNAICHYNSLIFRAIINYTSKSIISIAFV